MLGESCAAWATEWGRSRLPEHCARQWNWEVELLGAAQHRLKAPLLHGNSRKLGGKKYTIKISQGHT